VASHLYEDCRPLGCGRKDSLTRGVRLLGVVLCTDGRGHGQDEEELAQHGCEARVLNDLSFGV
jgi:hypothetical protein